MKKWIVCALFVFIFFISSCGADVDLILQNDSVDAKESESDSPFMEEAEDAEPSDIYVYICGAVNHPGVYELQSQSRIYELVEMAGGMTQDADEGSVNLAQTVEDGQMIRILTRQEAEAGADAGAGKASLQEISDVSEGKININTADVSQLTALNGIGEAKAAAIVSYREENGPFGSIEEIMQVSGIAEGTFNKIKDDITI